MSNKQADIGRIIYEISWSYSKGDSTFRLGPIRGLLFFSLSTMPLCLDIWILERRNQNFIPFFEWKRIMDFFYSFLWALIWRSQPTWALSKRSLAANGAIRLNDTGLLDLYPLTLRCWATNYFLRYRSFVTWANGFSLWVASVHVRPHIIYVFNLWR